MTKRNTMLDIIKTFAILGVISIHLVSRVLTGESIGTAQWNTALFWATLFRASVPLFLMCSGALMLDREKPLSIKKLYLHNMLRIVIAMLVWGFLYKIYHLKMNGGLNFEQVIFSLKRLFLFDHEFHFYYIHIILIVYAFLPIIRILTDKADKKLLEYMLILWFGLGIIFPTVQSFYPFNLLSGLTNQWAINLVYSSIGYGILGYYLKTYPLDFKKSLTLFITGFLIIYFFTYFLSLRNEMLNETYLGGNTVGVCIMASGLFSLAKYIKVKEKVSKAFIFVSKASFCVYLCHMFVLYVLENHGVTAFIMPCIISVPLLALSVLIICLLVYKLISHIPFLKKWIV